MKSTRISVLALALFPGLAACQQEERQQPSASAAQQLTLGEQTGTGVVLPTGSTTSINGNTLSFVLPEGYELIGASNDGSFLRAPAGTITCTCLDANNGCSPADAAGEQACVTTSCGNCHKEVKEDNPQVGINHDDYSVIRTDGFEFITQPSQLQGMRLASHALLQTALVESLLQELDEVMLPGEPGEPTKLVLYNLLGQVVVFEVPVSIDDVSLTITGDGGAIKCKCLKGGSCPKKGKFMATWCDASNCQSCEMSGTSILSQDGEAATMSISESGVISVTLL